MPSEQSIRSFWNQAAANDPYWYVSKPGGLVAFTLVPRDWRAWLLPALRVRAYLRQKISSTGPKGVYRKEWVGIRPTSSRVCAMSPLPLHHRKLDSGRILYYGRR